MLIHDIRYKILLELDIKTILTLSLINKEWFTSSRDGKLWKILLEHDFRKTYQKYVEDLELDWYHKYIEAFRIRKINKTSTTKSHVKEISNYIQGAKVVDIATDFTFTQDIDQYASGNYIVLNLELKNGEPFSLYMTPKNVRGLSDETDMYLLPSIHFDYSDSDEE